MLNNNRDRDEVASQETEKQNKFGTIYHKKYPFNSTFSFLGSVILHAGLLVAIIASATVLKNERQSAQIQKNHSTIKPNSVLIVQARAISSQDLNQKIEDYEQAERDRKERERQRIAKIKALELQIKKAKAKKIAEVKARVEAEKQKALLALKLKAEAEAKAKQAAAEARAKKIAEAKARVEAEKVLRRKVLDQIKAEQATKLALQHYVQVYKTRVEANWLKNACQNISRGRLPTVAVIAGRQPSIYRSSGSRVCDRSLLLAIQNARKPALPKDKEAKEIIRQGFDFQFGQ